MSSIFTTAESGALKAKSRFPRRSFRYGDTITFGRAYPALIDFMMAGDVYKINYDMLIRLMPMKAPLLNNINARVRFGYVPLRLIEKDSEFCITGSKDGKYDASVTVPTLKNIWQAIADSRTALGITTTDNTTFYITKDSLLHKLGMDVGSYTYGNVKNDESALAAWVVKAYFRFWWDYYRDENLYAGISYNGSLIANSNSDFDVFITYVFTFLVATSAQGRPWTCFPVYRKKDYLTSALPWQLKGVAPRIDLDIGFEGSTLSAVDNLVDGGVSLGFDNPSASSPKFGVNNSSVSADDRAVFTANFNDYITDGLSRGSVGITAEQIREVMAETRIMERLARCGSRYTEYLRANFGVSPADGTLQRSQYLGGGKMPVIVSEVLQTAGAQNEQSEETPVGTMRGHGITRGGNSVSTFHSKEFGVLVALVDLMPQTIYSQGVSRRLTYTNRWDFFNPSFQHLSEQTIRKGEIMYRDVGPNTPTDNNDTDWGFTGIYNEMRIGETKFRGDLIDNLSYWSQAINWTTFPELSESFIRLQSSNYLRPFAVTDESLAMPAILDIVINCDSYRPMIRYATPGLNDHF